MTERIVSVVTNYHVAFFLMSREIYYIFHLEAELKAMTSHWAIHMDSFWSELWCVSCQSLNLMITSLQFKPIIHFLFSLVCKVHIFFSVKKGFVSEMDKNAFVCTSSCRFLCSIVSGRGKFICFYIKIQYFYDIKS